MEVVNCINIAKNQIPEYIVHVNTKKLYQFLHFNVWK
jgi:hypothetical protein